MLPAGQARRDVVSLREKHATKVKAALAEPVAAAASRAREALTELRGTLITLGELNETLTANHADALYILAPDFSALDERLARLAERG